MTDENAGGVTFDQLVMWLLNYRELIGEHRAHLTALDSAIGDADHAVNMDRGMQAVVDEIEADRAGTAPSELFKTVGTTLVKTVGGTSGALYGTFFLRFGTTCPPGPEFLPAEFANALRAGLEGVVHRGKAEAGDKTMFDALAPAIEALDDKLATGLDLAPALEAAVAAANAGRDATVPMLARKGRASYLGERSIGHQDPGATSVALLIEAAHAAFAEGDS